MSQSAKYIEGLENRLGRMESLLRLSGLLSEDDGGRTDLGTLEKRLADRSVANGPTMSTNAPSMSRHLNSNSNTTRFAVPPSTSQQTSASYHSTPRMESHSSPRTTPTSPESQKSEAEVEGLSDMMCSLVTNNSGETRYIGMLYGASVGGVYADIYRVILWILHILAKRNPMGQREDRRHIIPGYDIGC